MKLEVRFNQKKGWDPTFKKGEVFEVKFMKKGVKFIFNPSPMYTKLIQWGEGVRCGAYNRREPNFESSIPLKLLNSVDIKSIAHTVHI